MLSLAQPANFKLRRWSELASCCLMSFYLATVVPVTPSTGTPQQRPRVDIHRNGFSAKMQEHCEHSQTAGSSSNSSRGIRIRLSSVFVCRNLSDIEMTLAFGDAQLHVPKLYVVRTA